MNDRDHSNSEHSSSASPTSPHVHEGDGDTQRGADRRVRIHIDRHPYDSPNPTTGEALYRLGNVPHNHTLYREVQGNAEDEAVSNNNHAVRVRQDEHFYSAEAHEKGHAIIVNGRPKTVRQSKLAFVQVVALAFDPVPTGDNWEFTVTYRNGPHANPQGTLVEGGTVRIKKGMIFNVTATDKS